MCSASALDNLALKLSLPKNLDLTSSRIAVAMSGGVDSSMVAYLLREAGAKNLVAFTAWTLNGPGKCCNDALINAGRICEQLGIPYDTVDLRGEFAHYVMGYYNSSYEEGLTPNPCVECNRYVKWEALLKYAQSELHADFIATGHYAQIQHHHNEASPRIFRGTDQRKDQSYMLACVKKEDLAHTLFPLADVEKTDLVTVAQAIDIPTAFSKESQDVCFVLDGQANYLKGVLGIQKGEIKDIDTGKVLGEHEGYYLFTLGQRKGLGVAVGCPIYVVQIDKENNIVYVGDADHLKKESCQVVDVNWINLPANMQAGTFKSLVKYRYNTPPALATCTFNSEHSVTVNFEEPATALSPAQIAAFYDLAFQELWGGGYIETHRQHTAYHPHEAILPEYDMTCQRFTF